MALRIITDSASDLTLREADELGVEVVPLKVVFNGTEYRDAYDLGSLEFFEKLVEAVELPTTSAVAPGAFLEAFQEAASAGDELLCILLSSKLSATFQSAVTAREMLGAAGERVHLFDSLNATVGEQLLVRVACALRAEGWDAPGIVERLEELRPRVRTLALLDTLEYLKKGGRIPSGVAFAGKILSIKPVITVEAGEVKLIGQARGSKNGRNLLVETVERYGGFDAELPFRLVYSGLSCNTLRKYWEDNAGRFLEHGESEPPVSALGPVIGTHIGPGALGVAFFSKQAA
ncbi:MAG: DegV family protein [Coriobacteriales bacterium]